MTCKMYPIVLAIITNTDSSERAADMICRVYATESSRPTSSPPAREKQSQKPPPPARTINGAHTTAARTADPGPADALDSTGSVATVGNGNGNGNGNGLGSTYDDIDNPDQVQPECDYSIEEAANRLELSRNYIHALIHEGKIASSKPGHRRMIRGEEIIRIRRERRLRQDAASSG